ncbi:MAG: tetratricopeptide repeat protein [Candidatus Melainabacteria bacterium]|nr:tetratricopeptide repeat protein [Candidatus Melainabacteria bacterium]
MKSKLQKLILAVSALICVQSAALAAPMTFESAVAEYKAGHYQSALSMFKTFGASNPNNAYVHYYIALCQHRLGHIDQARQEYQFVVQSRDAKLGPMAQTAMAQLSRAHTSGSGSVSQAPASGTTQGSSPSQVSSSRRAKKVIEFYADW